MDFFLVIHYNECKQFFSHFLPCCKILSTVSSILARLLHACNSGSGLTLVVAEIKHEQIVACSDRRTFYS